MSGKEIKKKIDENNSKLESLTKSVLATFILNPEVAALIKENKELQAQCPHSFKGGVCEFCGEEEPNGN